MGVLVVTKLNKEGQVISQIKTFTENKSNGKGKTKKGRK